MTLPISPPSSDPASARSFPMSDREFVGMMAAIMALQALAIDAMLPALPAIGEGLRVSEANRLQYVVTAYLFSNALGSLVAGPLSDRFGRRTVLLVSLVLATVSGLACALAPTFESLLALRAAHGFVGAGLGVLATSIIRDRFEGDKMARLMSLTFIVFMVVPIIAPSLGQAILFVANWREIFHMLAASSLVVLVWVALRLPETLHPEDRQKISPAQVLRNWRIVATHRQGSSYMLATAVISGGLFGFINSAQQIFYDVFDAATIFPLAFATVAGTMAIANFSNSRIVERFGARRVSHTALLMFILLGIAQVVASAMEPEPLWLFLALLALNMSMVGFTGANFGSIAMEPFGHIAGAASSYQSFIRLALGSLIGAFTGQQFAGTTAPLAWGFFLCGLFGLMLVLWGERGRLFTRPGNAKLRSPVSAR
jgi:MFS transporter, DHA1 family, multidrug resistance protein